MIKQDKRDFIYNVETLATGNDKEKLYDEILKLKNENQMKRTIYNDNKTRLLRPSLYDHFKNDKTISFCYKPLPSDEKDDNIIILNFSKNQNN